MLFRILFGKKSEPYPNTLAIVRLPSLKVYSSNGLSLLPSVDVRSLSAICFWLFGFINRISKRVGDQR